MQHALWTQALITGSPAEHVIFKWKPNVPTRLHVVRLCDGAVTTHEAPPFFTFHYVNAFEAEGMLCFDFAWNEV